MNKNTLSLLNSPWMIEQSHRASLYPYLMAMMRGDIADLKPMQVDPIIYMSWDDDEEGDEPVKQMDANGQFIPIINVKHPIFKYDQFCGPRGLKGIQQQLEEWAEDKRVMGVVFDYDTGGGQASGLFDYSKYVNNYPKPTVGFTDGYLCSAGYYMAAAHKGGIIASQGADFIGSLGTMLSYVDLSGILVKEGAIIEDIYAEGSPKKNAPFRLKDEKGDNTGIIKEILNPYRESFVGNVKEYRPQLDESVFDGEVYLPEQALKLNLIDKIGTIQDAVNKVREMAKPSTPSKKSKINKMSKTKDLPKVAAVLGLSGPLKLTKKISGTTGIFMTEAQLDAFEQQLSANEEALTKAKKTASVNKGKVATLEASIDKAISTAKLTDDVEADATPAQKVTLLGNKVVEYGKRPGSKPAKAKASGDRIEETDEDNSTSIFQSAKSS